MDDITSLEVGKKITSQQFYDVFLGLFNDGRGINNTEKEFIAINLFYILGLSSNEDNKFIFKNMDFCDIQIDKEDFNEIIDTMKRKEQTTNKYIIKAYLMTVLTATTIFLLMIMFLKQTILISACASIIYLVIDFIGINKTISKRCDIKFQKKIIADVDSRLIEYVRYYLSR